MHSEKKIITIITVTLNAERNIEKTIRSVQQQLSLSAVEHIIVDGGSTDTTIDIIRSKFPDVKIEHIDDTGIYDAMNQAMELASGEYIIFLNSGDTFCDINALSCYLESCEQNYDFTSSFYKINDRLYTRNIQKSNISKLIYGMPVSHQTLCVKKNILRTLKFNLSYKIAADYDQLIKILKNHKLNFHCIEKVLVEMEPGGLSDIDRLSSLREQLRVLKSHNLLRLRNLIYYIYRYKVELIKCLIRY